MSNAFKRLFIERLFATHGAHGHPSSAHIILVAKLSDASQEPSTQKACNINLRSVTLLQLCQNYMSLCVRIGKIERLSEPLNA